MGKHMDAPNSIKAWLKSPIRSFGSRVFTSSFISLFTNLLVISPLFAETLAIAKEKGAVFIMQIGGELASGTRHDGRAPDYDDWTLNGDIIFWYPVLEIALELSSMGIRVDEAALENQLKLANCEARKEFPFHRMVLDQKLPYTVGGGIGQSRICMFFLQKAHIGEVHASIWPQEMVKVCEEAEMLLL